MILNSIIQIWKHKGQILEGVKNNIFKREDVEQIASYRMDICTNCPIYDASGEGCMVPGTQPCCNQDKGGCGCSLNFKTRSLSSSCPMGRWDAELNEEEEDALKQKLGL
jgi:hypothetical protein